MVVGSRSIELEEQTMEALKPWYRSALTAGAVVLVMVLFVIGLPLLGLAALVVRTGVVVAFGLALVGGVVTYAVSPSFRTWFGAQFEPILFHKGLRLGAGVAVGAGHTWARVRRREATVGVDDLVQATLGPVDAVTLPTKGTRVRRGQSLFGLRQGERSVMLRAPVSGTVSEYNASLAHPPTLLNEDPYGEGWVVKLEGKDVRRDRRRLLSGDRALAWFQREVDRLIGALLGEDEIAALADGGMLVSELYTHVDAATWDRVKQTFFEVEGSTPPQL